MYGTWDNSGLADDPDAPPFEIPMQGMGLFACRRAAWPGFNQAFRGFGGEEWYIHEKFRRADGAHAVPAIFAVGPSFQPADGHSLSEHAGREPRSGITYGGLSRIGTDDRRNGIAFSRIDRRSKIRRDHRTAEAGTRRAPELNDPVCLRVRRFPQAASSGCEDVRRTPSRTRLSIAAATSAAMVSLASG